MQMKNIRQKEGITLIALVITIIVLLILAGVTISMLTGDNGILKNAELARIETRAASVEEQRDIWLAEIRMAKIAGGQAKGMEQILQELQDNGLLTEEEVNTIITSENNEITIGSRTISFNTDYVAPEEKPEVSIQTKEINTVTAIIGVNTSGIDLAEEGTYKYYLGEELKQTSTENAYVYTNLVENTPYTLKVVVTDKQGNETEKTIDITTKSIVPTNYVASSVDKENTINDGLVIYEGTEEVTSDNHSTALTDRNQYVWIPVEDINSMSMCKSNAEGSVCNLEIQTDGTLQCTVHQATATEIVGRLYTGTSSSTTSGSNTIYSYIMDFTQTNQTYNANSGNREPAVVTGNEQGTGTSYDGASNNYHGYGTASAFLEELEKEYIKMTTSVAKNGGFYVSRYEMGASGASKKNQAVINASTNSQMWYGFYKTAKSANTTLNSHMIWGSQYDQIIKFIGADAQTASQSRQVAATSGANSGANGNDKMGNLYDLEGNYYEWTTEAGSTSYRVSRGGSYSDANNGHFYPASDRYDYNPTYASSYYSARLTLYL